MVNTAFRRSANDLYTTLVRQHRVGSVFTSRAQHSRSKRSTKCRADCSSTCPCSSKTVPDFGAATSAICSSLRHWMDTSLSQGKTPSMPTGCLTFREESEYYGCLAASDWVQKTLAGNPILIASLPRVQHWLIFRTSA